MDFTGESIKSFIQVYEPIFFYVICALILILLAKNSHFLIGLVKRNLTRKRLLILLLVLIGITLFISLLPPKTERILYDEDIYINTAQNIVSFERNQYCSSGEFIYGEYFCETSLLNKQPPGYALTLSLFFRIFNISRANAFLFNNIIFFLTIVVLFLIVFLITKNFKIGIFSILLFSCIPIVGRWYNTAAAEPTSSLYLLTTILTFLIFIKLKKKDFLLIAVLFFILSVYTRYEFILLAIPFSYLLLTQLKSINQIKKKYIVLSIFLAVSGLILLLPLMLHYLHVRSDSWGASEATFSTHYFSHNFNTNLNFFIQNKEFPILALILLLGVLISEKSRIIEFIGLVFIVTFGIYLFFYAGSYEYGADIRYAINSLGPFIVLLSLGLKNFADRFEEKNVLIYLCIPIAFNAFLLVPQIKFRGQEGWQALWDIEFIQKDIKGSIQPNDYVFTNTAYSYHIDQINGKSTDLLYDKEYVKSLLNSDSGDRYFFHFGYWCSLNTEEYDVSDFCTQHVMQNYDLDVVVEKERHGTKYALYEITGVKEDSDNIEGM